METTIMTWLYFTEVALAIAIFVTMVVFYFLDRSAARLMIEFKERFPDSCFLCSMYRHMFLGDPPEHNCADWTGSDHQEGDVP